MTPHALTFPLAAGAYAAGSEVAPDHEPAWVAGEAFDVEDRGYRIAPDGDGWSVLAPPLGECVWVGVCPPRSRALVAEECPTVDEAWFAAVDHLTDVLTAAWCNRCGDTASCPDCDDTIWKDHS